MLSKRLAAIAAHVPDGAAVVDVGTDHGLIPTHLAMLGRCRSIIASDIKEGPLSGAQLHAREHEACNGIEFVLCPGLEGVSEESADTVILAGMGGETIAGILSDCSWAGKDSRLIIMQPMSKPQLLRRWLCAAGFEILSEELVEESGGIYPILTAKGGEASEMSEAEYYTGRLSLIKNDPLYSGYLATLLGKIQRAISGLEKARRIPDAEKLEGLRRVCAQLNEMVRRIENDQC